MILVTGGTGLVGSHLLFRLTGNGKPVRATYRDGSNLGRIENLFSSYSSEGKERFLQIDWVKADITDIPALEKAFEGIDHVYHCAAFISFDPKNYRKLRKVNIKGTANVVNLCISNSVQKLCYTSTIGTIGRSLDNEMTTEETEWTENDNNVYALTKYAAELEVWRGSQEGLPVVMVNPGIIIGPADWNQGSGKLFATAHQGYRLYPLGGTGFVTVYDVVRMMEKLMESPLKNERFIAVAENLTYREIFTRIAVALKKKPPLKPLKFWQLQLFRYFDAIRCRLTGQERTLTKNSVQSLKNRQIYDNHKSRKVLNFEYEDLNEAIKFTADQYLKNLS